MHCMRQMSQLHSKTTVRTFSARNTGMWVPKRVPLRHARQLLSPRRLEQQPPWKSLRCMASRGSGHDEGEKSWSDIGADVARLGRDLVGKVANTVKGVADKIVPAEKPEPPTTSGRGDFDRLQKDLSDGFGGGILGNLLGRAVGGVFRQMGEQMQEASRAGEEVRSRATSAIQNSAEVRRRLGGAMQVQEPVSQSVNVQSINFKTSRRVTLLMPVVGSNGRVAQAQVSYTEGEGEEDSLKIAVQMPEGDVVHVGPGSRGSGGGAGRVIDVDWREIR